MGSGIPYFPLDVDLDDKFRLLEAEFGITGFGVVVKLFQKIYGQQGYYIEWTNDVALLFGRDNCLGVGVVTEIISAAIRRGIFDKALHDKYGILTSKGIQDRYFFAAKRRKSVDVKEAYLLINASKLPKDVNILSDNVNISKENASIPEQSIEEDSIEDTPQPPRGATEEQGYKWIVAKYHDLCPSLPMVKQIDDKRRRAMRSARQKLKDNGCSFEDFFRMVEVNDFLTGRSDKQWRGCGFDWILKPANLQKILENTWPNNKSKGGGRTWTPG